MKIMTKNNQNNAANEIPEEQTHAMNRYSMDIPAGEGLLQRSMLFPAGMLASV
jgi:hypothetical protein